MAATIKSDTRVYRRNKRDPPENRENKYTGVSNTESTF